MSKSIERVYKEGLCCSCGMCIGTCPQQLISYTYDVEGFIIPQIASGCIECGICGKCCPGNRYYTKTEKDVVNYHTLYSLDAELRHSASSGGFVTELLCYLLNNQYVDYCVVIPTVKNSLNVRPIVTDNVANVRKAAGSKYITVEYGAILENIKQSNKRFAMVVLPCQEYAVRQYLAKECERVYIITLMCNHVSGTKATQYLLKENDVSGDYEIRYRGNGWPGNMDINGKNIGDFRTIYSEAFGKYFFNMRCKMCDNHFGKNSDITVGDPYFLDSDRKGSSFCIVRNNEYEKIIREMIDKQLIHEVDFFITDDLIQECYKGIFISEANIPIILKIRALLLKKRPMGQPLVNKERKALRGVYIVLRIYINKIISKIKARKLT